MTCWLCDNKCAGFSGQTSDDPAKGTNLKATRWNRFCAKGGL